MPRTAASDHRHCCVFVTIARRDGVLVCKRTVTVGNFMQSPAKSAGHLLWRRELTISTTKKFVGAVAAAGLLVALAGCGSAPEATPTETEAAGGAVEGFLPCMVSDAGGFDDKSFNQLGFEGLEAAAEELGVESDRGRVRLARPTSLRTSQSLRRPELHPHRHGRLRAGVGRASRRPRPTPTSQFVSIDDPVDNDFDGDDRRPEHQADHLRHRAGGVPRRLRVGVVLDGQEVVGTFGGMHFPTVSIFMDGFKQGVEYWNEQKGDAVEVLGWDGTGRCLHRWLRRRTRTRSTPLRASSTRASTCSCPSAARSTRAPHRSSATPARDIALLGVDADVFETDPTVADLLLTSIRKAIDVGVDEAVHRGRPGRLRRRRRSSARSRTRAWASPRSTTSRRRSRPTCRASSTTIMAGIIDGSIPVESYLAG